MIFIYIISIKAAYSIPDHLLLGNGHNSIIIVFIAALLFAGLV